MIKLNKKGFTLVELLAVIVILALLMVVALSVMGNVQNNTKKTALKTEGQKILNSINNDLESARILGTIDASTVTGYTETGTGASTIRTVEGTDGNYKYKVTLNSDKQITDFCISDGTAISIEITKTASGEAANMNYGWSNVPVLPDSLTYGNKTAC